ncbi:MAG: NAD(P)-binding domain-containing protein [Actinomycetia bacterium]|nr:NAD(P)-binding domain-containing protein [Actinomycetes bacterium]MCP4962640.1 NAD(P)-binding domain-containing protein [Actinomycetes bacterium]
MRSPIDVIQVAAPTWHRFGPRLTEDLPDTDWLVVDTDVMTLITADGDVSEVDRDEASPTVAWMCFDVFASPTMRPHFGLASHADSIELVHTSYAGLDGEYWARLKNKGVEVTSAHLAGVAISEFVMLRVLEWFHRDTLRREKQAGHEWHRADFREVHGSHWMIVGMGDIGSEIAVKARAFGATVTGVRRTPRGDEPVEQMVTPDHIHAAAADADVVVLAVPSTPDTDNMVDADLLAAFAQGSLLVNIGRGSLVDEDALRDSLDSGHIEGAILDVMRTEPLPADHWMWDHPSVWVSPHNSAAGHGRFERSYAHFIDTMVSRRAH